MALTNKGNYYSHGQAMNAMAPTGRGVVVSSFPWSVPEGETTKAIYVGNGDITVTDVFGTQMIFSGYQGWLELNVRSIDASSNASLNVLLLV